MGLNRKQIKFIISNKDKLSPQKISEAINAPIDEVKKIIEQSSRKAPFYFYIILILIPIIFFGLLELGLRVFKYGYDNSTWTKVTDDYYILNSEVARRYFTNVKNVPTSIEDAFAIEKPKNGFRVFVLGESSAAGYPYLPLGSFSRYLRKRLEITYPDKKIEVVNLGLSAISSYTILDLIPDVIEQKPDLILIYTGHNEYYGALGVGSLESLGDSRDYTKLILYLNKFKTTQLIRDIIQYFGMILGPDDIGKATGTLMSRMAKEKSIPYKSEMFYTGLEQFEGNLSDIIQKIKEANIPLIISTLASNLKDQPPFISIPNDKNPPADKIFNEASSEFENKNFFKADSLYRLAKDLDGLRFRAPEEINLIIKKLSRKYKVPVIDVDSLYSALSPHGIIGNNLMTDHLHPTLHGFHLIGKLFFEKMIQLNFLPKNSKPIINFSEQDSLTVENFVMPKLDSTVAEYRIKLLKNDWPFIDPKFKKSYYEVCQPSSKVETLAVKYLLSEISWGQAEEAAANWFFIKRKFEDFLKHVEALLYQYPFIKENFTKIEEIATGFLKEADWDRASKVLRLEYKLKPNGFSSKWLGIIELNNGNIPDAIKFLEEGLRFKPDDLQVLYNLAGAYALNKEYSKSLPLIQQVIRKDSNYPGAQDLLNQLMAIKK